MTQQPPPTSIQTPPEEPRPLGDQLKLIGAGALALALVIFVLSNLQRVEINFLWFDWHTRMIWALIFSALMGALSVLLISRLRRWRRERPSKERD